MTRRWLLALVAGVPLGLLPLPAPRGAIVPAPRRVAPDDSTCRICHPGPTRGLQDGPHAFLLARGGDACADCHGDLAAHAADAVEHPGAHRQPVPKVAAAACTACHATDGYAPALAAHPLRMQRADPPPAPAITMPVDPVATPPSIEWSGLLAVGFRILGVAGSRARYQTDIDEDPGFELLGAEIEGRGRGDAPFDLLQASAEDAGGPHQRLRGRFLIEDRLDARADYRKDRLRYRASGPYARVDRRTRDAGGGFEYDLHDDLRFFASYRFAEDDGFWLTRRLGSRSTTPVVVIDGVQSPRSYESDVADAGFGGRLLGFDWSASADYRDDDEVNRWTYSQPSSINPNFTDSEDFASRSTLRGPGGRASLRRQFDRLTLAADARYVDLERRTIGDGEQTGYDVSDFEVSTDSASSGGARSWLVDATATWELGDDLALVFDSRWIDHREELRYVQTEVTRYPTLGTTTSVTTSRHQVTSQRVFDGSVQADLRVHETLDLTVGYGFSREWLRVPDLDSGDNDFVAGRIDTDGLIGGLRWRPDRYWRAKLEWRGYGIGGAQLHELTQDESQRWSGRLGWHGERLTVEGFVTDQRIRNDIVRHADDRTTLGISSTWNLRDSAWLNGSWVFTDARTRTLTNFYFDPDPNPVPTLVGFDGETHSVVLGFGLQPSADVTWRFDAVATSTHGSFDVTLIDLVADLAIRVRDGGDVGVQWRGTDYEEAGGADDYRSDLITIYFRQRLGAAR
jgi:hypothetical protein